MKTKLVLEITVEEPLITAEQLWLALSEAIRKNNGVIKVSEVFSKRAELHIHTLDDLKAAPAFVPIPDQIGCKKLEPEETRLSFTMLSRK